MARKIKMVHPHLGEDQVPASVDEHAFHSVWAIKGWEEFTPAPKPKAAEARKTVKRPAKATEAPEAAPENEDSENLSDE